MATRRFLAEHDIAHQKTFDAYMAGEEVRPSTRRRLETALAVLQMQPELLDEGIQAWCGEAPVRHLALASSPRRMS